MYQSIFNRLPVIQTVSSNFAILAHFIHILASTWYAPWTIAVNVTWVKRGFNAGQTHDSFYPYNIFNRLRAINLKKTNKFKRYVLEAN